MPNIPSLFILASSLVSATAFLVSAETLAETTVSEEKSPTQPAHCFSADSKPSTNSKGTSSPTLYDAQPIEEGVTIHANKVHYQPDNKLELNGNVEMTQGRYHANSNSATINQNTQEAHLSGDIVLSSPDLILSGDQAQMNMQSEEVSVSNAKFSNPRTNINGEAFKISHPDKDTLIIHDGLFTSCPPEDRDWAFASEKITLDREQGFGYANNTRFLIRDVPVLYIPWFTFPIDDRRKSGFLYPTIGSSNTQRGVFLSTPYYFNLAPNYDATLTPSYIHGRGAHNDLELRHKSSITDTMLQLGYIDEDKHYNDEQSDLGFSNSGDRWGLNFEQEIKPFAGGWHGSLQYSEVSDNDYLDDLNQGLNIDRQDHLDRRAAFYFSQDDWRLSVLLQQYKSIDDAVLPSEEAYQRLPEVNLEFSHMFNTLHLDWNSQYVYFYRDREDLVGDERTFGSRVRHQPKLSIPLHKSWGYLKPSVTVDHTDYLLQDYTPVENHISRTVPIYELDSGLYFDRKSVFSDKPYFGLRHIRHSLEPRLYYVYSKAVEQDDLPNFDSTLPSFHYQRLFNAQRFSGGDRVGDNNRLTFGITSRWTDLDDGQDKAIFSLGQIYHYDDRSVSIDGIGQSDRSDSLLASELLLRPYDNLELAMTGLWDARERQTQEGSSRLTFHSEDYKHVLNFSHRYIRDELEQTDTSLITPIHDQLSLIARWRYDLDNNRTIGTLAGVEYGSCCWRVQLLTQSYLSDDSEILNGILFRFQLKGVGGFGQSTRRMDEHIPGYEAREALFN